jgi:hypothetical protein
MIMYQPLIDGVEFDATRQMVSVSPADTAVDDDAVNDALREFGVELEPYGWSQPDGEDCLVREVVEIPSSESLLTQWEDDQGNTDPDAVKALVVAPGLIRVTDGQHTWYCLEAEYDAAIEMAATMPPAKDGDAYTAICRLIDTVCLDGDYSGPQANELKATIEAAGLEECP